MSETFGGIGSEAISAVPVLEKTKRHLGEGLQGLFHLQLHRRRLRERRARDAHGMHRDIVLIERRDKLLSQLPEEEE